MNTSPALFDDELAGPLSNMFEFDQRYDVTVVYRFGSELRADGADFATDGIEIGDVGSVDLHEKLQEELGALSGGEVDLTLQKLFDSWEGLG